MRDLGRRSAGLIWVGFKNRKPKNTSGIRHTELAVSTPNPAVRARLRQLRIHLPFPLDYSVHSTYLLGRITARAIGGCDHAAAGHWTAGPQPRSSDTRWLPAAGTLPGYNQVNLPSRETTQASKQASSRPPPASPANRIPRLRHAMPCAANRILHPNETQHMAPRRPSSRVRPGLTPVCPQCCVTPCCPQDHDVARPSVAHGLGSRCLRPSQQPTITSTCTFHIHIHNPQSLQTQPTPTSPPGN